MVGVRNYRVSRLLLLVTGLIFLVGCSPEFKIGSQYLSQRSGMTMVIRAPEWVKMVNLSADSTSFPPKATQREKDSIGYFNSKVLKDLKDSTIIKLYVRNLQQSLQFQGYKTIIASKDDTIFPVKQNAFLINIGQIEVDESKMPFRDETKYNGKLFGADYDQTKIEMSVWIEISKIVDSVAVEPTHMLYDSYDIHDNTQGDFRWDYAKNSMDYILTEDEILPQDVYDVAKGQGTDHGIRLDEYLLNEYISFMLPDKPDRVLMGIDNIYGTVKRIDQPPFQEIHE